MTAPNTSSPTSNIGDSQNIDIDALLSGYKWGSVVGSGATITFSFPWTNGSQSVFLGPRNMPYSSANEASAAYHYGLNLVQQVAAIKAINEWANVANINFSQVSDSSTNVGDIRFAFTSSSSLTNWWGYAYYPNFYYPSGGDIWINYKYSSNTEWSPGTYNYEALMHEIGHALGLKHPFEDSKILPDEKENRTNTIMSYTDINNIYVSVEKNSNGSSSWFAKSIDPETPMVLDIQAIQYMYGANNTYKSGNDIYTFDKKTPFLKTIWDAGGIDTISITDFSTNCIIDLRPGKYSTIAILSDETSSIKWNKMPPFPTYDNTPNLGIAYNCIIENVIGGLGDDLIYGNQADNLIDGGGGINAFIVNDRSSKFSLIQNGNRSFLTDKLGSSGTDTLTNINSIQFSDVTLDLSYFIKTSSLSKSQITSLVQLYIASFNRAPDAIGLDYWGSRLFDGMSLKEIAKSFFVQKETTDAYPASMPLDKFINTVYQNVLNRGAEDEGFTYWTNELKSGRVSKDSFLLAIINGAQAPTGGAADRSTLANKQAAGSYYALEQGLNNSTSWAKDVMAGVNANINSVLEANAKTDHYAAIAADPTSPDLVVKLVGVAS